MCNETSTPAADHAVNRFSIYNLHNGQRSPTKYCDLVIDGDSVLLEKKQSKEKYDTIPWSDLRYQVDQVLNQNKSA